MGDFLEDLKEAARNAVRNAEVNIHLRGDGTSDANVSYNREKTLMTLAVAVGAGFLLARLLK